MPTYWDHHGVWSAARSCSRSWRRLPSQDAAGWIRVNLGPAHNTHNHDCVPHDCCQSLASAPEQPWQCELDASFQLPEAQMQAPPS